MSVQLPPGMFFEASEHRRQELRALPTHLLGTIWHYTSARRWWWPDCRGSVKVVGLRACSSGATACGPTVDFEGLSGSRRYLDLVVFLRHYERDYPGRNDVLELHAAW